MPATPASRPPNAGAHGTRTVPARPAPETRRAATVAKPREAFRRAATWLIGGLAVAAGTRGIKVGQLQVGTAAPSLAGPPPAIRMSVSGTTPAHV